MLPHKGAFVIADVKLAHIVASKLAISQRLRGIVAASLRRLLNNALVCDNRCCTRRCLHTMQQERERACRGDATKCQRRSFQTRGNGVGGVGPLPAPTRAVAA